MARSRLAAACAQAQALVPGLCLCIALALLGLALGRLPGLESHGLGGLTITLVLGLLAGHALPGSWTSAARPGATVSRQTLLRLGVVLYGARLTLQDVAQVGWSGVAIDAVMLASTFLLACWLGLRVLRMDRGTVLLIGAGSSICGAAAILATEPVVRARAEQVTVSVAMVVVFGTLATLLDPLLHALDAAGLFLPRDPAGFGVFAGSTIHEVAQVVATARSVASSAVDTALIEKMVRVMMLAPFLAGLSAWLARDASRRPGSEPASSATSRPPSSAPPAGTRIAVPTFALGFVGVVLLNSSGILPRGMQPAIGTADLLLLGMAMAALGLSTHVGTLRRAGPRPLVLAAALATWLLVGGALVNRLLGA